VPDIPIRVDRGFTTEFPGASRSATEAAANLVHTAAMFLDELNRRRATVTPLSPSATQVLAVLDGADEPLPSNVIAERLLITTASMTSLLDTLQRHGLIRRTAHPSDRRKILVEITPRARDLVDRMLPVLHTAEAEIFAPLPAADRAVLIDLLARVQSRLLDLADAPTERRRTAAPRRRTR
jgi:DNA-binding MarR family transcriptional regulator